VQKNSIVLDVSEYCLNSKYGLNIVRTLF